MKVMTTVKLNKKEKAMALRQLNKMEALFRDGKGWIQGEELGTDNEGNDTYCLIGALEEVGGSETTTQLIIGAAIDQNDITFQDSSRDGMFPYVETDVITEYNDNSQITYNDIKKTLQKAKTIASKGEFSVGMK